MKKELLVLAGIFIASAILMQQSAVSAEPTVNLHVEVNKITLNMTDVNTTGGYYAIDTNNSNYLNGYESNYFCPLNATACLAGFTEEDPLWSANYSGVAFTANQGGWNVNSSVYWYGIAAPLAAWTAENEPSFNGNWTNISSWLFNQSALAIDYLDSNPFNWIDNSFNATYDALKTDNESWNQSFADALYYPYSNPFAFINDTTWQYNQTQPAMDYCDGTFITLANEGNLNVNSSVYWDGKSAFPTLYEANISDLQSYLTSEAEAMWNGNYSGFLAKPNSTFNQTYNDWNKTYADALYNPISAPGNTSNNSLFFNGQNGKYWWNITGGIPNSNITITANFNMTTKNITQYLSAAAVPTCLIKYNSTGSIKFCDCYNDTMMWSGSVC